MTPRAALVAAVIADPDDDTNRLAFADWCAENGEPERGEFVRVQCGPNFYPDTGSHNVVLAPSGNCHCRTCRRERRERELLRLHGNAWVPRVLRLPEYEWLGTTYSEWMPANGTHSVAEMLRKRSCDFRRGFVESVTCTAADWLKHADALVWTPAVECGKCKGAKGRVNPVGGYREFSGAYPKWEGCHACTGTGRVPNPVPPPETAQPIRRVVLTTIPTGDDFTRHDIRYVGVPMGTDGLMTLDPRLTLEKRFPGIEFTLPAPAGVPTDAG